MGCSVQFPACCSRGATFPFFQLSSGGCTFLDAAAAEATVALSPPKDSFRCPVLLQGPGQMNMAFAAFPALFHAAIPPACAPAFVQ